MLSCNVALPDTALDQRTGRMLPSEVMDNPAATMQSWRTSDVAVDVQERGEALRTKQQRTSSMKDHGCGPQLLMVRNCEGWRWHHPLQSCCWT